MGGGALGQLDTTYGYYFLDPQYAITTSAVQTGIATTTLSIFRNLGTTTGVTVTAGWTSETVRDGVSIIHFDYSYTSTWNVNFGNSSTGNRRLTIDCPELILSGRYNSVIRTIGIETKLKAIVGSFYNPGYNTEVHNTGNITIPNFTGGGGYSYIYNYGETASNFTIDIDYWSGSYQNYIFLYYSNSSATFSLALKEFYAERALYIANQSGGSNRGLSIPFKNGWAFETRSEAFSVNIASSFAVTENFGTVRSPTYYGGVANIETNIFSYLSAPSSNIALPNAIANIESDPNSILKTIQTTGTLYRNFARTYTHTQTLETTDFCPIYINTAVTYGSPMKINVLSDTVSGRPCQFIPPTAGGACMLVFNSPSYNNKLVWHFFSECNGRIYADTFFLKNLDPSKAMQLTTSFTTTSTPGLTLLLKLYLVSKNGTPNLYGNITPTVDGTNISSTTTIGSAYLTSNDIYSAFVIVEATKTSTAVANLSIDILRVDQ